MSGPSFFQTIMGRQFYDGTMPRLANAAEKIAASLERIADQQEVYARFGDREVSLAELDGKLAIEVRDAKGGVITVTLPDEEEVEDKVEDKGGPRVIAHFQPQVWMADNAVPVEGAYDFDVTDQIKAMSREEAENIEDQSYGTDALWHAYVKRNPSRDHGGPFEVSVEDSLQAYFLEIDRGPSPKENEEE